jgi:hypothetical protein
MNHTPAGKMNGVFRLVVILASAGLFGNTAAFAQTSAAAINPCTPWPATDALGRKLPMPDEVGPPQAGRFVGILYSPWHDHHYGKPGSGEGPTDISKLLARDPDLLRKPESPLWKGYWACYWGEPLFGYYSCTDPWVLRRHANLLADAGIDTLIFDVTNAQNYPDVYHKMGEVFQQMRGQGDRTPQIAFMLNTKAGESAARLYQNLYRPGLYRDLWFHWQGKPLMLCDPAEASPELRQFFTLRRAHWPNWRRNTPFAWHWEAVYPQPYGYTDDPKRPEQVNVSVAQNLRQKDAKPTWMSFGDACGRSFHDGKLDRTPGATDRGYNFQEQWKRAFELKPPFVMVTGWNEWVAGRHGYRKPGGTLKPSAANKWIETSDWLDELVAAGGYRMPDGMCCFCDQFSPEFSRDIEPMKGGHGDNYYWQLVANVRRFKGAPALPQASPPLSIRIDGGFSQWRDVAPEFLDHVGETAPRDYDGVAGLHYTNRTGRNDLVAMKVAHDRKNVYFYVRTREPLSSPGGSNWMWLLIDADQNAATGWQGYDFIVNRTLEAGGKTWLEKNEGGWRWRKVAPLDYRLEGNELHLAIPRAALGLAPAETLLSLDFKWADNVQSPGDVMDFYTSGDVAPEGRFMYRYVGR